MTLLEDAEKANAAINMRVLVIGYFDSLKVVQRLKTGNAAVVEFADEQSARRMASVMANTIASDYAPFSLTAADDYAALTAERDRLREACEAYLYGRKPDRECEAMMRAALTPPGEKL